MEGGSSRNDSGEGRAEVEEPTRPAGKERRGCGSTSFRSRLIAEGSASAKDSPHERIFRIFWRSCSIAARALFAFVSIDASSLGSSRIPFLESFRFAPAIVNPSS